MFYLINLLFINKKIYKLDISLLIVWKIILMCNSFLCNFYKFVDNFFLKKKGLMSALRWTRNRI